MELQLEVQGILTAGVKNSGKSMKVSDPPDVAALIASQSNLTCGHARPCRHAGRAYLSARAPGQHEQKLYLCA